MPLEETLPWERGGSGSRVRWQDLPRSFKTLFSTGEQWWCGGGWGVGRKKRQKRDADTEESQGEINNWCL